MDQLSALLLGVVEGLTEFLPVSSTGHLIMTSNLLGLVQSDFLKSFEISIQLGAVCAVLWETRRMFLDKTVLSRVIAGFIPTAVLGLLLYKIVKSLLLGNEMVTVLALGIGGIVLIGFEMWHSKKSAVAMAPTATSSGPKTTVSTMTYTQAVSIGLGQSLAMVPGVSRSAASIVTGMALGLPRTTAVEFSFLLAVPTIAAATALDILKGGFVPTSAELVPLAIGFISAGIVAAVTMRFLLRYVRTNTFIPFGVYRIAVALLYWKLML